MTDEALRDSLRRAAQDFAEFESPAEAEALTDAAVARLDWRLRRGHKVCPSCGTGKPVSEFGQDASRRDGLEPRCRECRRVNGLPATG